jgi:hypothetical protein
MAITISDEGGIVMGEAPENHTPNILTTSVGVTHLTAISATPPRHDGQYVKPTTEDPVSTLTSTEILRNLTIVLSMH